MVQAGSVTVARAEVAEAAVLVQKGLGPAWLLWCQVRVGLVVAPLDPAQLACQAMPGPWLAAATVAAVAATATAVMAAVIAAW